MNIVIMHQPILFSYEPLVVEVLSHTNQNAFRKLVDDRLSGFVVPCPLTLFERSSLEPEAYLLFQERKRLAFLPETPPEFNESNLPTDLPLTIQSLCKMLDTRQLEIISKYGSVSRFLENLLLEFESLDQYSRLSKLSRNSYDLGLLLVKLEKFDHYKSRAIFLDRITLLRTGEES